MRGHDKMVLFSENMLKSSCAMRFICLKYIHAGSFFCKKIFLIFFIKCRYACKFKVLTKLEKSLA